MKKTFKKIIEIVFLEKLFYRVFFLNILQKHFKGQHKVLELGAGRYSYIKQIDKSIKLTAIDLFDPSIGFANENRVYDFYIKGDVKKLNDIIPPKSFDTVVAFDLIEHLTKEDGLILIKDMSNVAKNKIIIYTPNGFLPQPAHDNNPFQEHISGWSFDEMKKLGFKVYGINGHKKLRNMFALPAIKPQIMGNFFSNISMLFLKLFRREELAFAILCIKNVK